jgi:hypothetical protein
MKEDDQRNWRNEVLDLVFDALAGSSILRSILVFKGARVLHRRLDASPRKSFDIDANLELDFAKRLPSRVDQQRLLQAEIDRVVRVYFESQPIVRFELTKVAVIPRPIRDHHLGWNAFKVTIGVVDRKRTSQRGVPNLELDIAAPEALGPDAVAPLKIGIHEASAYTLERLAGEKLRAFLSSLPAYRTKVSKAGEIVRTKDIYDLAFIVAARPVSDGSFWSKVHDEFRLACQSRYVDCEGIATFEENLPQTRALYEADATLPKDIAFESAWSALCSVVGFFEKIGAFPLRFPLP